MSVRGRAAGGWRRALTTLASAALVASASSTGLLWTTPIATAAPAVTAAGASVAVALTGVSAASLHPGATYTLGGTLRNLSSAPVRSLSVRMRLAWERLDGDAITAWAARSPTGGAGVVWATKPISGVLAPGAAVSFSVAGAADALGLPIVDGFGPRGLAVEVVGDTGDGVRRLALVRSFVVWDPGGDAVETQLSVLAPITPPDAAASSDAGVAGAEVQREWGRDGRLSRIITATADPAIGWAVDPSLLTAAALAQGLAGTTAAAAGVAASGASAASPVASPSADPSPAAVDPVKAATAKAWSEALGTAASDRDVYALPWGDPDLVALARAGAADLLAAAQDDAVSAGRRVFGRDLDHTLAWPVGGQVDVTTVAMLGRTTGRTIVMSRSALPESTPPEEVTTGRIALPGMRGDVTALVADPALGDAVAAMGGTQPVLGTQRVLAELAAHSVGADAAHPPGVLAALPRGWDPAQPEEMAAGVALLRTVPWIHVERLGVARERTPGPAPVALADQGIAVDSPLPAGHVRQVHVAYQRLFAFRGALTRLQDTYVPLRRAALSLVGQGWRSPGVIVSDRERILAQARAPLVNEVDSLYSGISVATGSPANLLARSGRLPVTVTSTLKQPVNLVLTLRPLSGRLQVGEPQRVSLGAATNGTARANVVMLVNAVASGDVDVVASLSAPGGVEPLVVAPEPIRVRIRHDWEDRGLTVAGGVLGSLLVLGLFRSVRRGRRARVPLESVPDPDDVGLPTALPSYASDTAATPPAATPPAATTAVATPPTASTAVATPPVGTTSHRAHGADATSHRAAPPVGTTSRGAHQAGTTSHRAQKEGGDSTDTQSLMRSSALMTAGTLVSRILGMARAIVLSAAIGAAVAGDAFTTANTLPNNLFILIGGGVLNAVLVPQIVRAATQSDGGKQYVDRLLTLAILVLGGATIVLTAAAPLLIRLYTKSWTEPALDLGTAFALWCLPQIFFYGLYTLYGQVLNARGSFGPYMWAPVVNNVVAIAGMGVFVAMAGGGVRPVAAWSPLDIAVLAGTATLGVVAQALVLIPVMRRSGYTWHPRWGWRGIGLGRAGSVAAWTFAGVALSQLAYVVVSRVVNSAGTAVDRGGVPGGRMVFDNAFLIFMLPHSLIAVSVVTAMFTRMSRQAADGRVDAVRADLSLATRTVAVATVFATAAFAVLGPQLTYAMFIGTGRASTDQYALVAMAMLAGVVPYSAQYVFQRVFYAYEDARTPFMVGAVGTAAWTAGALLAASLLEDRYVAAGVGLSLTVSNLFTLALWVPLLRRRLGSTDGARILRTHLRLTIAAGIAAAVGVLVREGTQAVVGDTRTAGYLVLAVAGGVMLLTYLLALRALRVRELDTLLEPVLSRLGRR
jgi:putative peptidoglycan lipid II flippase